MVGGGPYLALPRLRLRRARIRARAFTDGIGTEVNQMTSFDGGRGRAGSGSLAHRRLADVGSALCLCLNRLQR